MSRLTRTRRTGASLLRLLAVAIVVALGAGAIVAVVDDDSWPAGQAQAVAVVATTQRLPVLAWLVAVVTAEPRVEETVVAGARSTVVRPGDGRRWPAVVFVNGATRAGRHHPQVERLAHGLARAGFLVVVPDLPGLRGGEITLATAVATTRVAEATAARSDVQGGRVGLYGVSVGASLALLAAENPRLASRISVVGGEAPWVDLRRIVRLTTTGSYDGTPYETNPYALLAIGRSLAAGLPAARGRSRLLRTLRAVPDDAPEPMSGLDPRAYDDGAHALAVLLSNDDPARFGDLYARLPKQVRTAVEALSPLAGAERLRAPAELASGPNDKYFPPAESRSFARAARRVRVTITSTFDHAVPRLSVRDVVELARFDGFVVRFLRLAR